MKMNEKTALAILKKGNITHDGGMILLPFRLYNELLKKEQQAIDYLCNEHKNRYFFGWPEKKMKYVYFVSFTCQGLAGNVEIVYYCKITNMYHIKEIEKDIENRNKVPRVYINNYILLREEEEEEEEEEEKEEDVTYFKLYCDHCPTVKIFLTQHVFNRMEGSTCPKCYIGSLVDSGVNL